MEIVVNNVKYEVIKNVKDALNIPELSEKLTDYFDNFDYIVGDCAYDKLRLKGFNEKTNKNFKPINDYSKLEEYVSKYCAYGCKYFVISKVNGLK